MNDPLHPYVQALHNQIDLMKVPFSDRGSRLLLYRYRGRSALYLKLAERLEQLQPGLETHRNRPPFLRDITFLDGHGQALDFELETYPHAIHCQTSIGKFNVAFAGEDVLAIGLPPGQAAGISLTITDLFESPRAGSGHLINSRHLQLLSNQNPIRDETAPMKDGLRRSMVVEAGKDGVILINLLRGNNEAGPANGFAEILAAAQSRWAEWFGTVPTVSTLLVPSYAYAWWSLANNLVAPLGNLSYHAVMPSKAQYLGIWNWDACFHAVALRHIDPELARDQLRTILGAQREDGMLPDVVHDEGIVDHIDHPVSAQVTKPPVITWSALKIHEIDPDVEFLREIYPAVKRWNHWWRERRASRISGLSHYLHPYSSGLDDNPMWDHGFPVVAPDLNTYLVIQMEGLAHIAELLGLDSEARSWQEQAQQLTRQLLDTLYDADAGLFWARHDDSPIHEQTPFTLYPLWTGRLPPEVEEKLVNHLTDPALFWSPYPLRTVAGSSHSYSATTMWRGPVWININYIFVEALARVGRHELARALRDRTIELVSGSPGMFEYYNPEDGTAPPTAAPMFGWTAALFIDLCLQQSRENS